MPDERETTVKHYTSAQDFERDQKRMAAQGWSVVSTTSIQPRQGIGRMVTLGPIGAAIFKPKSQLVITYSRAKSDAPLPDPGIPAGLSFGEQVRANADREAARIGMPPGLSFWEQVEWKRKNRK